MARSHPDPIGPEEWFVDLLWSSQGLSYAAEIGIDEEDLNTAIVRLREMEEAKEADGIERAHPGHSVGTGRSKWRASEKRAEVLRELNDFGRMLTEGPPPKESLIGMEDEIQAVLRALVKRKQRSALIIGLPGTGKTALVRELARRLMEGHPSIPQRLRDHDIFELSPTFLRSGASLVGEYDERVTKLIRLLTESPQVVLFVDEVHSLLQSGIHERGNFTDANEAFKKALSQGDLSLIGATTTAEFRYYLEPDRALVQRFSLVRITPPTPMATREIISRRRAEIEEFYQISIPEEILPSIVDLTEEYLPTRAQPRKSIQLLDETCAYCVTRTPPLESVTRDAVWEALESTVGHDLAREDSLTEEAVFQRLSGKIVGQNRTLKAVARAFISGLGGWARHREAPRGVFFFGGPTGVGKTETAILLSHTLGDGRESMVRVDCNTLQPSGSDSGQAVHVLLGPPPGYIGYVRGKGGLLSRIRDIPESIVLFDEIEKADPAVGEILLQIMDSGRCEDSDGNLLDFRRSFLVFTTNAGSSYADSKAIGFESEVRSAEPTTDPETMKEEIRKMGLGEEFLGRISHFFLFDGLGRDDVEIILQTQMEKLRNTAEMRGFQLFWNADVIHHLSAQWQPRFGVRHLLFILRNRILEQLSVADAQGELKGVMEIRLEVMAPEVGAEGMPGPGSASRRREGDTFFIGLT
jgi:ATP-dependent Clp protease ATP-binding subunit ClpA